MAHHDKSHTFGGTLVGEQTLEMDSDNTVRTVIIAFDMDSRKLVEHIDLDNADSAQDITFSPLGDYAFVTTQGNNSLTVLDVLRMQNTAGLGSLVGHLHAGAAPQSATIDKVTGQLAVKNLMGRSVTIFDLNGLLEHGNLTLSKTTVSTIPEGTEKLPQKFSLGKTLFYHAGSGEPSSGDFRMSSEGYMSCATCHTDGSHDGQTWDFLARGEGFRNTIDLRGRGGMVHGNVHWTANFDEIQDFEIDIRHFFGGSGLVNESSDSTFEEIRDPLGPEKKGASEDLDALASYVSSLHSETLPRSPHRKPEGEMTDDAIEGVAVFKKLKCHSCHNPKTNFVDGKIHDIGTTIQNLSGNRLGGTAIRN